MQAPSLASDQALSALGLNHRYRLDQDPRAPLVYLVHGRAGDCSVMWLFQRALVEHCHVIAPEAPLKDPIGGYSWWSVADKTNVEAEQASSVTEISRFLKECPSFYNLEPRSTIGLGFSQGAATLSIVQDRALFKLDGLGILSGFTILNTTPSESWSRLPVFVAHGTEDQVVEFSEATSGVERLRERGAIVRFEYDTVGHKVGSSALRALREWIGEVLEPGE